MTDQRKTVLITGCSSGIGHALAREFHSRGFRVFATARNASKISDLASQGIETFSLELQKAPQITALKDQIATLTGGKLDYLVNNAGRAYVMPALDLDLDEVRDLFETNLFAVMRMCKEFAPLLINAKGTILQVGSLSGVMPFSFSSAYNASKAALHHYSDTLRVELSPFGVRVINLITGGVKSELARVDSALPSGSYYSAVSQEFKGRITLAQRLGVRSEVYAKDVVDKVIARSLWSRFWSLFGLGGPRTWIWAGSNVLEVWLASSFLPRAVLAGISERMGGLYKLKGTGTKKIN